jgi:hypothetical protein
MTDRKRSKDGLLYHDDAHRDAWSGLSYMGLWDYPIPGHPDGTTFGEAIDAVLAPADVPAYF